MTKAEKGIGFVVLMVSFSLAAIRVEGHTGDVFKDIAHMWVAWLFGVAVGSRRWPLAWIAIALSLLELACFLLGVGH